jgi:two-component system sensor histidine kinase QseC
MDSTWSVDNNIINADKTYWFDSYFDKPYNIKDYCSICTQDSIQKMHIENWNILKDAFARDKRFAADAAHELKTPLAAMKTQAQVALKASNSDRRNAALENVIAGVDRSTHIVQQLLTLNRLGPGSSIKKQKLDLEPIIREVLAELAVNALHKNIDLEFKEAKYPAWIYADKASMAILVRNLIDNAIRYTPEDGKVSVAIINTPQHVIFRVTDTGPGIPEKLRDRIFERFFRVLGTKQSGSGLGLAIVQQIAKLHNADINVETPASGFGLSIEIRFQHS